MTNTADLLSEYASALRGSWGDIDGRSEQISLNKLAELIRKKGADQLSEPDVVSMRDSLSVCPSGEGHWTQYCDESCDSAYSV